MFYPIHLNIEHLNILIIGGGRVAFRRSQFFLACKKQISVVSKCFIPEFDDVKDSFVLVHDNLISGQCAKKYIAENDVILAATNDHNLNREIASICKEMGKLVNVASEAALGFHVPATVKQGDLLISIGTGGRSPALCAQIAKELRGKYSDGRLNIGRGTEET